VIGGHGQTVVLLHGDPQTWYMWRHILPALAEHYTVIAHTKLTMPVLAVGAQYSLGDFVPTQVRNYATNVTGMVIKNSGHWIYEEPPAEITRLCSTSGRRVDHDGPTPFPGGMGDRHFDRC
jgi:pimeloyl-ACP methyl ester carboxylesterase